MKIKVSEASGVVLDFLVSKADNPPGKDGWGWWERDAAGYLYNPLCECRYSPSTDWSEAGPIIEREEIDIYCYTSPRVATDAGLWISEITGKKKCKAHGRTPLIAAMRCYVASKLGDTVEVPEELK